MSLSTYADLQASVANWLHRSDLTAIIPDLVTIAEMRMNSDIIARDMEVTVNLTTVPNVKTLAMPTDVTETRRLVLTSQDPKRVLTYIAPENLTVEYPYSTTGIPEVFTVIGNNFEFGPTPDNAYTLEYVYRQRITPLATTGTNWLMTKWPHVYLYATLCAAAPYLGQDQRVAVWEDSYQKAVQDINSVDWFSGSVMKVRTA